MILARHTRIGVEADVCYGQTDVPLADTFEREASDLLRRLPHADRLLTSPLIRCAQLAQRISTATGLEPEVDHRLKEMDFGAWEGRRWSEIPREEIDAWNDDILMARPHGGESVAMLEERTAAALSDYRSTGDVCLVVTHGGVVRSAMRLVGDTAEWPPTIPFGSFVILD